MIEFSIHTIRVTEQRLEKLASEFQSLIYDLYEQHHKLTDLLKGAVSNLRHDISVAESDRTVCYDVISDNWYTYRRIGSKIDELKKQRDEIVKTEQKVGLDQVDRDISALQDMQIKITHINEKLETEKGNINRDIGKLQSLLSRTKAELKEMEEIYYTIRNLSGPLATFHDCHDRTDRALDAVEGVFSGYCKIESAATLLRLKTVVQNKLTDVDGSIRTQAAYLGRLQSAVENVEFIDVSAGGMRATLSQMTAIKDEALQEMKVLERYYIALRRYEQCAR